MQPAGPAWCAEFPTSTSLNDLAEPFQDNCRRFIAELQERGAIVTISATYRPPERAWLMHYCCMIATAKQDPSEVPVYPGIDIQWDLGSPDATRAACSAMMKTYGIVFPAALVSRHTQRRAIDMTITGQYGMSDSALWAFGKQFGVIKLVSDAPHWSDDGH